MKVSEVPADSWIVAECQIAGCHGYRYLTRALLIEKVGDVQLEQIAPRVRCLERSRHNKRGPACGGRMRLGLDGRPTNDRPSGG